MKLLDLFSGIGGFHLGLEHSGFKFDWVGFSEIDKFASQQYKRRFPNATELGDITSVRARELPNDITILCGGFPCQAFSMAGKRKGFEDTRGTLFFEIARILRYFKENGRPIPYFVLENVKGLLSHDDGRTFATIYGVLTDLDYTIECQLLNTRWFLPQNRERIYIVGHLRRKGRSKIFPIAENDIRDTKIKFYGAKANREGQGLQNIEDRGRRTLHRGKINVIGNLKGESGHECHNIHSPNGIAPTVRHNHGKVTMVKPVLTPNRAEKRQNGRRFKEDGEDMFTLTSQDQHGVKINSNIRRLTPTECERLQGFPDGWTEGQSDTQRYKQLGNAVSVPVVQSVGDKIFKLINKGE
jgi:DNA (cytosine-5)-methyltransferase 1